jgi:hypothetical protein
MPVFTDDGRREGDYEISASVGATGGMRSRDQGILLSGTVGKSGMVCGLVALGAASAAAKAGGNTGNGTITMDVTTPVLSGALAGVYRVSCIAAAANAGNFRVEKPNGDVIGEIAVGATFSDDIKFVINDGATDYVVGDAFDVTVAAGSGKYTPLNTAGNDGREVAAAILFSNVDASLADKPAVFHVRETEVHDAKLIWPAGISAPNKAAAIAALKTKGIIVRT